MRDFNNQICNRADDLVAFLYHELNDKEASDFENHLHECASCKHELASFGEIRESIVSWRDVSLGSVLPSLNVANEDRTVVRATPVRQSALAAIREFFNLSPLWMKGAAVFASLLFCVCAVLAIASLKESKQPPVQAANDKLYSQAEMDKQLAATAQATEQRLRNELAAAANDKPPTPTPVVPKKRANRLPQLHDAGYALNRQDQRKPLTAQERRELAADLGLTMSRDDDDLELVTDKIPQTP